MSDLDKSYYAVVFTSVLQGETDGYEEMSRTMVTLAKTCNGFIGIDSVRGTDGFGITVSYWRTEADIVVWRQNVEHRTAQQKGKSDWYSKFRVRVCRVEREYGR